MLAGICCFIFYYGCDPISENRMANKNQIASLWIIESLGGQLPSMAGVLLAAIFANAISHYTIGMSRCADTLINECFQQVLKCKIENHEFFHGRKLAKFAVVGLLTALSIVYTISFQHVTNTLISLFFVHSNSINSPILGLFLLSMFNPYANFFGATVAFLFNIAINVWMALGAVVFNNIKVQEFSPNTFLCSSDSNSTFEGRADSYDSFWPSNANETFINVEPISKYPQNEVLYYLFSISGIWYCLFSVVFTFGVGSVLSFLYTCLWARRYTAESQFYSRKAYLYSTKTSRFSFEP